MITDDLAAFAEQAGLGAAQIHLANLTSHERAMGIPRPTHGPLMAATIGFGIDMK